jgi:hypothetical protein
MRKENKLLILPVTTLIFLLICLIHSHLYAAEVSLAWNPVSNATGYKIYWGQASSLMERQKILVISPHTSLRMWQTEHGILPLPLIISMANQGILMKSQRI